MAFTNTMLNAQTHSVHYSKDNIKLQLKTITTHVHKGIQSHLPVQI